MKNELLTLRNAGYREKAFAKSVLAEAGLITFWPDALEKKYDPSRDFIEGIGKVRWEGSDSLEILTKHGLNAKDCLSGWEVDLARRIRSRDEKLKMKTIQIEANDNVTNNEILRAAGVKKIHSGWYSVKYNGVQLDRSTVVSAKRNAKGEIK